MWLIRKTLVRIVQRTYNPPNFMALTVGTLLGRYKIVSLLGKGGVGEVYKAHDTRLNRTVAIKVLLENFSDNPQAQARFKREAEAIAALDHPHICTLHDVGEHEGIEFLVMELLEGETLAQRLDRGPLPLDEALKYAIEIADALDKAHRLGVTHRDMKPGNIMITKSGIKLLDFGLAKLTQPENVAPFSSSSPTKLTAEHTILGTLQYMAPEQLDGKEADVRTDIFAFGAILYETIAGERAFQGTTNASLIAAILSSQPLPISSFRPETQPALDFTVRNCLLKNPEDRWQTAHDLLLQLKTIAELHPRTRERNADINSLTQSGEVQEAQTISVRKSKWVRVGGVTVGLIVLLFGGWIFRNRLPFLKDTSVLAFQERDWVLIPNFENRTGEAIFDGTLEYALESDLSNSRFVNVVPRERIEDTLKLMKKPLSTPIDFNIGREICVRDGAIRALLAGRIEKLGTTYVVALKIMEPHQGLDLASTSEEVKHQEELLPAIQRLADWTRKALGEARWSSQVGGGDKFEHLTTSSLQSLRLFTQADALMKNHQQAPAEPLLRGAIAEDSEFAFAHIYLAWCLYNQHKPSVDYMQYADRALKLSPASTDRERYFIEGSYYEMGNENDKAIPVFLALLRLYPDDFWATNNLGQIYRRLGRISDAESYDKRRAELRPSDITLQWTALRDLLWDGKLAEAQPYVSRLQKLVALNPDEIPGISAWIQTFPAYDQWLRGNVKEALNELDHIVAAHGPQNSQINNCLGPRMMGETYMTLGRFSQAKALFNSMSCLDSYTRSTLEIDAAFARGDEPAQRAILTAILTGKVTNQPPGPGVLALSCRMGLVSEVRRAIRTVETGRLPGADVKIIEGELALAEHRAAQAILFFKEGLTGTTNHYMYFLGSDSLSRAMESQDDLQGAIRVLESASQVRTRTHLEFDATVFWYQVQLRLAQFYRKAGRENDAQRIEKELAHLLEYADRDFYALKQIKK
jgi:serine/threonine protein kinase/tetratricopeptide (TPR) repeat protein